MKCFASMTPLLSLALCFLSVRGLRVCSRKRYAFTSTAVLQRVHMPSHESCVERCVENLSFCKTAVFTPHNNKTMGVCTLFSENSAQQPTALHADAAIEPVSTVHEFLESCPKLSISEITHKISATHRKKLEGISLSLKASEQDVQLDASFPDRGKFDEETFHLVSDRYAIMTPLSREENVQKQLDLREIHRPKSPFDPVQAIVPVDVLYMGKTTRIAYDSCEPGKSCMHTLASYDSSPCPAQQGDPCAPRPPCYETACSQSHPQVTYSTWSEWSACSQTCGSGIRKRYCSGIGCPGASIKPCIAMATCQEWSAWTSWTPCSVTCGEGERKRRRECIGGRDCPGVSMTVETCASVPCPTWTDWGPWEGCSVSCGQGYDKRSRKCQKGLACPGSAIESKVCVQRSCPQWTTWSAWTTCSKSCDTGEMLRTRECENGSCEGASEERLLCNQQDCPKWTEWTSWTVCSNKCDEDTYRIRNRICMYGGIAHSGCDGPAQDQSSCPTRSCPSWSDWGEWSECSTTCGQGNQTRMRTCESGTDCPGSNREIRFCQLTSCPYWDQWMDWSGCSVSCGVGVCERRRRCVTDDLLNLPNLEEFDEAFFEMDPDKAKSVLIARSRSNILRAVNRTYITEDVARRAPVRITNDGGGTCTGSEVERKACDAGPCCSWDMWSEWSPCIGCGSQTVSKRTRICQITGSSAVSPSFSSKNMYMMVGSGAMQNRDTTYVIATKRPAGIEYHLRPIVPVNNRLLRRQTATFQQRGVQCCDGPSYETRPCNVECEQTSSCGWTEWSEWCGCSRCRSGREMRRRFCERSAHVAVEYPVTRCDCVGRDTEERQCVVESFCDPLHSEEGRSTQASDQQSSDDLERDSDSYVAINSRKEEHQICRWSQWSEWSQCHKNNSRQRKRLCVENDATISDCKCKEHSTEEEACDYARGTTQSVSEPELEFRSSDEDLSNNSTKKCEWTKWSQWSACTVTCGTGERVRKRRCSCSELRCGIGPSQETSKCYNRECFRKMLPLFNIE